MADTTQDRTEPATPRRREEARNRGQVAKSSDLTAAIVLTGGMITLYMWHETLVGRLVILIRNCLGEGGTATDPAAMVPTLVVAFQVMGSLVLPVMLIVMVLALAASFAQVGVLFTAKPVTPSLEKVSPLAGMKRMFSARSVMLLVMGVAKMTVLAVVAWWTLRGRLDALAHCAFLSHLAMVELMIDLLFTLSIRLTLALLILAIIDYVYQRWKMERDLRMTRQEVREELKRMDGDPHLKRRRREMQMQLALRRIRAAVPKADVVVTNPTEFAVAIQYDSRTMTAPKVTAKGADFLAARIRELAIEHGVPIVERPPLARAIYRTVEVGQEIPAQLYRAVAEVLAYVYELAGRGYRRKPAG
ncbi:MAG: flagellar biosynthesis protein FlhB [Phycisphaerae bacterium]|nr:flagellar biosynthesis protein FlhB [Phycisphaerae bacterium]